jgi:hypothetical protein
MMTRQLASITLTSFLIAPLSIGASIAQAKQPCSIAMPSDPHGQWWSYRLIDGRKCWYEGKPGLSKSLLEWPTEALAGPASGKEPAKAVPEKSRDLLDSQAWAPDPKAWAPDPKASAPTNPETFEAIWGARAAIAAPAPPEQAASNAEPAAPEVGDAPPLRKADRLPSPYLDGFQARVTHTLVIIPDQRHSAVRPDKSDGSQIGKQ